MTLTVQTDPPPEVASAVPDAPLRPEHSEGASPCYVRSALGARRHARPPSTPTSYRSGPRLPFRRPGSAPHLDRALRHQALRRARRSRIVAVEELDGWVRRVTAAMCGSPAARRGSRSPASWLGHGLPWRRDGTGATPTGSSSPVASTSSPTGNSTRVRRGKPRCADHRPGWRI